jgi:bla regulator protein BlaR1
VASIKPGDPASRRVSVGIRPGGRFVTANASLQTLIGFAYDVRDHQIAGGPNWLDSAKFDIEAKAPGSVSIPRGPNGAVPMRLMVESLLAKRFRLAVHRETRVEQVYELVLGKGGSKLLEVQNPGADEPNGLRMGRGEIKGKAASTSLLATQLSQRMGRSVIDKTGLTGRYDFTLKWTPDPGAPGGEPVEGRDAPPPSDSDGPSIFTALQEQLGLRLQSAKGPVEILVIDHAEKPNAN